jgi:hypothetical protein
MFAFAASRRVVNAFKKWAPAFEKGYWTDFLFDGLGGGPTNQAT